VGHTVGGFLVQLVPNGTSRKSCQYESIVRGGCHPVRTHERVRCMPMLAWAFLVKPRAPKETNSNKANNSVGTFKYLRACSQENMRAGFSLN